MENLYMPGDAATSEPESILPNESQINAINFLNNLQRKTINTSKKLHIVSSIIVIVYLVLSYGTQVFGSENIRRGERPYINLAEVPANAYEKEAFRIKLTPEGAAMLDEAILNRSSRSGTTLVGIEELDSLNIMFGISSYEKSIQNLYHSNTRSTQAIDRHSSWGFNQWFDIYVDQDTDIVELVKQYTKLSVVLIAEPVYKKVLHFEEALMQLENAESSEKKQRSLNSWIPNDPFFETQWHLNNTGQSSGTVGADIHLTEAWETEKGNPAVIVAIIDGGIDYTHNDLAGNMWDQIGYNFVNNSTVIIPHNHGTHIAGTVAAVSNNETGVSGIAGGSGVNDGIRLMSCQVFTQTSMGGFHTAFLWAADNGAAIANNSWTYSTPNIYEYITLDAIDYFNSHAGGNVMEGGVTIFSAGNGNSQDNFYPACYRGTVAVAATNNKDEKASYSNYANWIDISAPGGETTQLWERGVRSTIMNNNYAFYQGTSAAAPHVSGVAALIISYANRSNAIIQNTDLINILLNSTDDHYAVNPLYINKLGSGRVNAGNALALTQSLIGDVSNPATFFTTPAGCSQIDLYWSKNEQNDDVMIIYAEENIFGQPIDGVNYNPGQILTGGGYILYKGNRSIFQHINLISGKTYYYKIFSATPGNQYSFGLGSEESTECVEYTLPFMEDFESGAAGMVCWEIIDHNHNGRQAWQIGSMMPPFYGANGNYAFVNSGAHGYGYNQNTDLITPTINLNGLTNITLSFTHYYRHFENNTASVWHSIDNGTSWTLIQQWNGTTSNPAVFTQQISALDYASQIKFKWNYTGGSGFSWCVEDIMVNGIHCQAPTLLTAYNITDQSAQLSWQNGANELQWDVLWGVGGFDPAIAGQQISNLTNTQAALTNLSPDTQYDFYVRSVCGGSIYSEWEGPVSFRTLQQETPGDANCDGTVDVIDIIAMTNYILGYHLAVFCFENADIINDGIIDILDVVAVLDILMSEGKHQNQSSTLPARLYSSNEIVYIESDGNVSALHFEINFDGSFPLKLASNVNDCELIYTSEGSSHTGIIYSNENKPFAAGNMELFRLNPGIKTLEWGWIYGANTNAERIQVLVVNNTSVDLIAFPNPTKGSFAVQVTIESESYIDMELLDISGRLAETINHNLYLETGLHTIPVNENPKRKPGIYLFRMTILPKSSTKIGESKQVKVVLQQ